MSDPASTPPKTIPAATVIIFRNAIDNGPPELLMVQRSREMRFAGGAAVFPGGKVDAADYVLAAKISGTADVIETAARIAAMRETLEETGLAIALTQPVTADEAAQARAFLLEQGALEPVLERFGWTLDLASLVPFARWCPMWDGSFDTHFYLANLGTGAVDITIDLTENTHLFWSSAANTLALADAGDVSVIFPTQRNLDRLALFANFSEARAQAEAIPVRMISPSMEDRDGEKWLTIPDGHGYPVTAQSLATVTRG